MSKCGTYKAKSTYYEPWIQADSGVRVPGYGGIHVAKCRCGWMAILPDGMHPQNKLSPQLAAHLAQRESSE